VRKRNVPLASFVWDDGWDDPQTLWRPLRANFPRGFEPILERARSYESWLGFWLSPFGGYGQAAQDRLAMGKAQGFEIGPRGFILAGTNYYARFFETCVRFIREAGANFFKFDGLARDVQETEAMLRLIRSLREVRPDLFVSITTGTWPSPFWLWWGDSTWRGGDDMGYHGQGSRREQWITYRDMETYRRVVCRAPLYPLNSLMTQGFALARHGSAADVGVDHTEVRHDLRSFFASGTCLQELYVTPSRMTKQHWDDLAECAAWALSRTDVLVDAHWVGGDPGTGEVYGWASWSPERAVLALRNPTPFSNSITLDLAVAFELPRGAAAYYRLRSPWWDDKDRLPLRVRAGKPYRFELQPFEVVVYDVTPE
ncbi:MAG: enterotoxin, partial [Verrucomicrobiae bacterium]|nr:enterotoxin [Verrucomicrobiae bacterium]